MRKTPDALYKDVQASIKAVLSDMERLAALPPDEACNPLLFDEARRRVVRRFWQLYKDAVGHANTG